jgi:hypothetical protein
MRRDPHTQNQYGLACSGERDGFGLLESARRGETGGIPGPASCGQRRG